MTKLSEFVYAMEGELAFGTLQESARPIVFSTPDGERWEAHAVCTTVEGEMLVMLRPPGSCHPTSSNTNP